MDVYDKVIKQKQESMLGQLCLLRTDFAHEECRRRVHSVLLRENSINLFNWNRYCMKYISRYHDGLDNHNMYNINTKEADTAIQIKSLALLGI